VKRLRGLSLSQPELHGGEVTSQHRLQTLEGAALLRLVVLSLVLVVSCTPDSGAEQAGSTSVIELRLVRDVAAPGLQAVEYDGETMYVEPVPVLSDRDLVSVEPSVQPGALMLHIRLTPEAAERIASVSSEEIGSRLAIIIDSKVRSTPVIRDRLGHRAGMMIGASQEEATRLAAMVRARWP